MASIWSSARSGIHHRDPSGAVSGLTWTEALTITDNVVRSQSGRILQDTIARGTASYVSAYSYDTAGRLVAATIPHNALTYPYASAGGCGVNAAAGADGYRTGMTDSLNGATPTTTAYCYDNADRLTGTTTTAAPVGADPTLATNLTTAGATPSLAYDAHGNTTTLADGTRPPWGISPWPMTGRTGIPRRPWRMGRWSPICGM
jgi:YD repeat-containing protein